MNEDISAWSIIGSILVLLLIVGFIWGIIGDEVQYFFGVRFHCPDGCISHKPGCDIKGNVVFGGSEKIYHVPGDKYYWATKIDARYGERWFCTEAEALANGWRHSSE